MKDLQIITERPGFFKALTQVMSYGFNTGFFPPMTPIPAQAPSSAGRLFDYRPGINLDIQPRRESGITFQQLKLLADNYDLLRLVIETRKDQVAAFDWDIVMADDPTRKAGATPDNDTQGKIQQVKEFLMMPDGRSTWHQWLRTVLEDSFVLDANVFWPVYQGGKLLRLESVDPSTIMKFIDASGRQPEPPLPAYRQILHGVPTSEYKKDELMYFIRNIRNHTPYGLSPVEQVMMTINIGMRRELSQLQFFTTGNIPEAIAGVPDTWTPEQIKMFQSGWDAMFEGDTAQRRKMMFVPNDASKILQLKGADALLKNEFDEWIVRIICYAFSVPPTPFIKQMNRATAENASDTAKTEGLGPLLDYIKDMMDQIIQKCLRIDGVQFMWNLEVEQDPATQQTIDVAYIQNGVWSIDEVRERMGLKPLGVKNLIWTTQGPVPVAMFTGDASDAMDLLHPKPQAPDPNDPNAPPGKGGPPQKGKPNNNKKPPAKGGKGGGSSGSQKFRKAFGYGNTSGSTYRSSRQYITTPRVRDVAEDGNRGE